MAGGAYTVEYEDGWYASLARLHISIKVFENLVKHKLDTFLALDPYDEGSTRHVPGTAHRQLVTEYEFGDIPAMLVAYRVEPIERKIYVTGAVRDYSDADLFPPS